ncbi:MAG: class I SAM-dependent methyltransferase [Candidatus Krumholzibacteria bacterium]|nr:class I SAM-dependent methyltransferase [Candidatus Krumholzibacteria bacterium]
MEQDDGIEALERYYRMRAPEYDDIYARADDVRRGELASATEMMKSVVDGRRVLEVACGTGFWTHIASEVATKIVAIDASSEMLDVAGQKKLRADNVTFIKADAYRLDEVPGTFDAGVASFWVSHVPKARLKSFLSAFHQRLGKRASVFMMDNFNTPGYGGEFLCKPGSQDTFKLRELADGSKHTIIKNYFDTNKLRYLFAPVSNQLVIGSGTYYWWLSYVTKGD